MALIRSKKRKITYRIKRGLALALCLANLCSFAFCFGVIPAAADDEPAMEIDDISGAPAATDMALHLITGSIAGTRVQYFAVRYKDTYGSVHTQIVHPNDAKKKTNTQIATGTASSYSYDETAKIFNYVSSDLTLKNLDNKAMSANSDEYLLFKTAFPFASLEYIDVYVHYDTVTSSVKNEWRCLGLELIKIKPNTLSGYSFVGAVSNQIIPNMAGTYVAIKERATNYAWSSAGEDKIFRLTYNNSNKDCSLVEPSSNKADFTTDSMTYFLEMDIADVVGAGLENMINEVGDTAFRDFVGKEQLTIALTYTTLSGGNAQVVIPVTSAYVTQVVTQYKLKAAKDDVDTSQPDYHYPSVDGTFRQGDTIGLTVTLPSISTKITDGVREPVKFTISYGGVTTQSVSNSANAFSLLGGILDYDLSCNDKYGINKNVDNDNNFRLGALRLYQADGKTMSYTFSGGRLTHNTSLTADPDWVYTAQSQNGSLLSSGSSKTDSMESYEGGNTTAPLGETYLVRLTTDTMEQAGTNDELSFSLTYIKKSTGAEMRSSTILLSDASESYYGYWQAAVWDSDKKAYDYYLPRTKFGYLYNVLPGKSLNFFMQLSDVKSFTGATFNISGTNDWQAKSIEIYKVTDLGTRKIEWKKTSPNIECQIATTDGSTSTGIAEFVSDRIITRELNLSTPILTYDGKVLVTQESAKTIRFDSGNVEDIGDVTDEEYSRNSQYLSFEDTKKNFGFTKERVTYDITVAVSNEVNTNSTDGDCGSKNQFYFQLVFTDGKSGYVLANQQLSADGFRTGTDETFRISTNRDYGDLKSVHIIPEDPTSDEETFDKLRIDTIYVAKVDNEGIGLEWEITVNDWISIDYEDSGADTGYEGEQGKTEAEMARTYAVTANGYSASLMVAITTANTDVGEKRLSGNVSGEIWYIDNYGSQKVKKIDDITKLMYEYNGKSVNSYMTVVDKQRAVVDQSVMGRANHTDRFFVKISGITQIQNMYLTVTGSQPVDWRISDITIYMVEGSGQVVYNDAGEYENTGKTSYICTSSSAEKAYDSTVNITLTEGQTSKKSANIPFTDNKISVKQHETKYETHIEKEPLGEDDSVNIFVFMKGTSSPASTYNMDCSVYYHNKSSDARMGKNVRLNVDTENNVFYKKGVALSGLNRVDALNLLAVGSGISANVDYAIIEHMRSGVLISTSYFAYNGANATTALGANATSYKSNNVQYLTFELTEDSATIPIDSRTDDIAVSITYTTLSGKYAHSVNSINYFLSENETGALQPGHIYTIKLEQNNVSTIKSVNFVGMGAAIDTVGIKYAYIVEESRNSDECIAWYSFAKGLSAITASSRSMTLTNASGTDSGQSVAKVTMLIKTGTATMSAIDPGTGSAVITNSVEPGTAAAIKMTMGYYDASGKIHYTTYRDIRQYATSGDTFAGNTMELTILVPNFASVRTLEFTPTASIAGEDTTWRVESVTLNTVVLGRKGSLTRYSNGVAEESAPLTVNMSDVEVSVATYSYDPAKKSSDNRTFSSKSTTTEGMQITGDRTMTFTPSVSGSSMGVTAKCYKVINSVDVAMDSMITVSGKKISDTVTSADKVVFNPLASSDYTGFYKIVFTSNEFSEYKATVYVTVAASTFIVVKANAYNAATKATSTHTVVGTSNENKSIEIIRSETVTMIPTVYGSDKGVTAKCYKVIDNKEVLSETTLTASADGKSYTFDSMVLETPEGTYKVVFTSEENPDVTATATIVVKATESTTAQS